jgi:hypothetical protein
MNGQSETENYYVFENSRIINILFSCVNLFKLLLYMYIRKIKNYFVTYIMVVILHQW